MHVCERVYIVHPRPPLALTTRRPPGTHNVMQAFATEDGSSVAIVNCVLVVCAMS